MKALNKNIISEVDINLVKQWNSDKDAWKQLFGIYRDKIVLLKIKLIRLIRRIDKTDHELLDNLEQLQTRILQVEQVIQILRIEIAEHEKLLSKLNNNFVDQIFLERMEEQHNKLKREVQVCENNCYILEAEFERL